MVYVVTCSALGGIGPVFWKGPADRRARTDRARLETNFTDREIPLSISEGEPESSMRSPRPETATVIMGLETN